MHVSENKEFSKNTNKSWSNFGDMTYFMLNGDGRSKVPIVVTMGFLVPIGAITAPPMYSLYRFYCHTLLSLS